MPPLFISPPFHFARICCGGIFISNLHPPLAIHGEFSKNGRTLELRQTRGRLELTVPPYIESSYLWPAIHRPSGWIRGSRLVASWWWCENCIVFSDAHTLHLHWWFHDSLPCRTEPLRALLQAAWDSDGQFCHCCFLRALYSEERGHINETNYQYSIISPPLHTCS